jgi:drug/metabolite transporter (DMT)-like permease
MIDMNFLKADVKDGLMMMMLIMTPHYYYRLIIIMTRNQRLFLGLCWTLSNFCVVTQGLQAPSSQSRQQVWNKGSETKSPWGATNKPALGRETPNRLALSRMTGTGGDENEATDTPTSTSTSTTADNISKGRGLLLLVAVLYGTLNVSLRLVYALPDPPTASALSATRGWLAAICFIPLLLRKNSVPKDSTMSSSGVTDSDISTNTKDSTMVSSSNTTTSTSTNTNLDAVSLPLLLAGLELAVWNFGAQGLLNLGLLSTGSARASFLTQTSVVLTPIISLFAGQQVKRIVWLGCAIALGGLTLLSGGGIVTGGLAMGDLLVLGGALCWSLYLFRLSVIGERFDEIKLQAWKTTVLAVLYSAWMIWETTTSGACQWVGWQNGTAWALLLYSALGPGTVADVWQQQGQRQVSASEANVLLSLEPVFAALCARVLMGETTSLVETMGGGLILLAALIATR